jgi:hypothetical protein
MKAIAERLEVEKARAAQDKRCDELSVSSEDAAAILIALRAAQEWSDAQDDYLINCTSSSVRRATAARDALRAIYSEGMLA